MASSNKGLWGSMVHLDDCVQKAITIGAAEAGTPKSLEASHELDLVLQRHRSTFISLLRYPPKSPTDRALLQKAANEPVSLPGFGMPTKLPETFIRETLIISDMFDLNELSAFTLLRSAEEEKTLYPGTPRGLIAILFYYDSRLRLANAFKTLVQARVGFSWTMMEANEDLAASITRYLDPILNISCVDRILELITNMDLTKEVELLQQNRALGDAKHRKMVLDKFKTVRLYLAETLFYWSAQTPLKKDECRRLISYLSKVNIGDSGDATINQVDLTILMALLYGLESSHLLYVEDVTEASSQFPVTSDSSFIPDLHRDIENDKAWTTPGLKSVVELAWAVSLSNLREVSSSIQQLGDLDNYFEMDDDLLDEALKGKVFSFMAKSIFSKNKSMDSFFCQRFHGIFSDMIFRMPEKIKQMKMKADENARAIMSNVREGLQPPSNLVQPYEDLLGCLTALYESGQCGELVEDYWCDNLPSIGFHRGQGSKQMALYKFVRLPGDFLPPSLFVPYIDFLTSLSTTPKAAQAIYNFLKINCQPASQGSNLSWDHFLSALAQYFNNLRVEQPISANASVYRSTRNTGPRCISPQEMQGLLAVLKLISQVCKKDECARVALSDSASWSPILVSTGLLTCSVPLNLKTHLVYVLTAFSSVGSTPALSVRVWQAMESSGVVPPIDGVPGYSSRGLRQDIEEIESSHEEFPLSQAILSLLLSLVKSGIPYQLSSRNQSSLFKPYFDLVKNQIFLAHDSRTYKQSRERWAISRGCMELFYELLHDYHPPKQVAALGDSILHPAHMLLLDLLHDSRILKQILSILHDAVKILDQHQEISGQSDLEETLLYILKVLLKALDFQRETLLTENGGELLLVGLDRMLQAMNTRSGACDHILNIASLITHHSSLSQHAAIACKVITRVCNSLSGQSHLLPLLGTTSNLSISVRLSFVQILDLATIDEDHLEAANASLELLKTFLQLPSPTYAHYLLGFLDGSSLSSNELRTDLLEPGVRGFPRTMIHALLGALPLLPVEMHETAYHLIYVLAKNPATSAATLRYLSSRDFVRNSMATLSMNISESSAQQMSTGWILHIAALDLRYHAAHQQRSQLRRLIHLLILGTDPESESACEPIESNLTWGNNSVQNSRGTILSLLDVAELSVEVPMPLQCQYLTRAPDILKSCEENKNGSKMINIQKLHENLMQVLQDNGATAPLAQRDPFDAEIQSVLDYALSMNQTKKAISAQRHFLESLRQLIEIAVAVTPAEVSEASSYSSFLHTLTLELTQRLLDEGALPELTTILVSTLLLLVTTLRTLHGGPRTSQSPHFVPALDGNGSQLPSSLQLVLRGIVDCIVRYKNSSQSVRASIYAALLNYLHIHADTLPHEINSTPSLLHAPRETQEEQFHRENYEAVRDYLPQLLDVLSCEAAAGHNVCRVLALTCLDSLAALERRASPLAASFASNSPLLSYMIDNGHLRRLLDGIILDDKNLVSQISEGGQDLRSFYVWEARASLLARLTLTPAGARSLLQSGLVTRLSEMQIFQYHPDDAAIPAMVDNKFSCVGQIYSGVMSGALQICISILTALGPQDFSALSQVLQFLAAHVEAVTEAMRLPSSYQPPILNQLSLLTAVVSVAAPTTVHADPRDPVALEAEAQTRRLHKQLLNLLPHFLPDSRIGHAIEQLPEIDDDGSCIKQASKTSFLKVLSNCLCHARDQVMNSNAGINVVLLFHPSLDGGEKGHGCLTLRTLIDVVEQLSLQFTKAREASSQSKRQLEELETIQYDSLLKYVSPSLSSIASPSAVRQLASAHLTSIIELHNQQEEISAHGIEAAIYLLWRHLEYFLLHATKTPHITDDNRRNIVPRNLTVTQAKKLQEELILSIHDLLPKLQQVNSCYTGPTGHVDFLAAATTRIRKLLASNIS